MNPFYGEETEHDLRWGLNPYRFPQVGPAIPRDFDPDPDACERGAPPRITGYRARIMTATGLQYITRKRQPDGGYLSPEEAHARRWASQQKARDWAGEQTGPFAEAVIVPIYE